MREPDEQSQHARAWNLDITKVAERPTKAAMISAWLVNMPGAHAFWSYWTISIVSLRDLPGVETAVKHYPEAEYEFTILAINPEELPNPDPDEIVKDGYPHLLPPDVVEQFHGISETDCRRLAEGAIKVILTGRISPDEDFRRTWKTLIAGTVQHFVEGRHPLN